MKTPTPPGLLLLLAFPFLFSSACGDDDKTPMQPEDPAYAEATTPDQLVENLVRCHEDRSVVEFDALLDDNYVFTFAPFDADVSPGGQGFWERAAELDAAQRMFRGEMDPNPCYLDIQAGIEKAAFTLMIALSGADLVLMGGPLGNAAHQSYESLVIDHDIWEFVERCTTEVVIDTERLAYETAVEVGIGGSYFETDHTLRWLRSGEHYYGGSFDRSGRPGDEYTMLARAHERVEEILSQPLSYSAPGDALERIKHHVRGQAASLRVAAPDWVLR